MSVERHDLIRRRAHEIWENEGRPEGAQSRHWQQASDEVGSLEFHETPDAQVDRPDRGDSALLQGAGESGLLDPPPVDLPKAKGRKSAKSATPVKEVEITTGEMSARSKVKKTEGP
jgi:hypothetical protein